MVERKARRAHDFDPYWMESRRFEPCVQQPQREIGNRVFWRSQAREVADPRNGSKPARETMTCMARHGRAEFFAPPTLPTDVSAYAAATEGKFVASRRA